MVFVVTVSMAFSKSFPRTVENSNHTKWEEVFITSEEEREQENIAREENLFLMKECIIDARDIFQQEGLRAFQSDMIRVAATLFEKRASHTIFYKENRAKEKFDLSNL